MNHGPAEWRRWLLNRDPRELRERLISRIAATDGIYRWGVVLTGEITPDRAAVVAVTPHERLHLTPALLRSTERRLTALGGYARIHLYVPASVGAWPDHVPLPEVGFRITPSPCAPGFSPVEIRGRMSWTDLSRCPVYIMTTERLDGWPL